ncbi:MAG: membrane protein insertion efficiency factor YidD [Bdellovibrionales bacterium]|nr:membrane protein insertion efficiency factor YidD [Bdellovibrionales bacterium]
MKYLSLICLFFIKIYQVFLSVHFGGACRFHPSCSCYAERAFLQYSFFTAFSLVLKRLAKCHFFGPFGLNPLPSSSVSKKEKKI